MRYLITGGAGFLGSHLCEALLNAGHEVKCIDSGVIGGQHNVAHLMENPRFDLDYQDVCHTFDCGPIDGIFHLASPTAPAETYKHPRMTLEINSNATLKLLWMAEKYNAKFLFASSVKVKDDVNFGSTYIQGKMLGERFCDNGWAKVARMGNVYGPRMAKDDSRVIPTFIRNVIAGKPLSVWGDGEQIDSFCYVDDAIRALISFMDSDFDGVIEFGASYGITILNLAKTVLAVNRVELPIVFDQPGGGVVVACPTYENNRTTAALAAKSRKVPNISAATNYLGWQPQIGLHEGILKTTEYYKEIMK